MGELQVPDVSSLPHLTARRVENAGRLVDLLLKADETFTPAWQHRANAARSMFDLSDNGERYINWPRLIPEGVDSDDPYQMKALRDTELAFIVKNLLGGVLELPNDFFGYWERLMLKPDPSIVTAETKEPDFVRHSFMLGCEVEVYELAESAKRAVKTKRIDSEDLDLLIGKASPEIDTVDPEEVQEALRAMILTYDRLRIAGHTPIDLERLGSVCSFVFEKLGIIKE